MIGLIIASSYASVPFLGWVLYEGVPPKRFQFLFPLSAIEKHPLDGGLFLVFPLSPSDSVPDNLVIAHVQ